MSLIAGRQEQDSINVPQAVVGIVGAIIMLVATYFGIIRVAVSDYNPGEANTVGVQFKPGTAPQFGMLHQTLFESVSDAKQLKRTVKLEMASYGWVDKEKGTAHIPIQRAMQLVSEGKK
jgi:hypothetical protein